MRALFLLFLCTAHSFTASFVSNGTSRRNETTFPVLVRFSEAIDPQACVTCAIQTLKGSVLRNRTDIPLNLDYDTPFTIALNNQSIDSSGTAVTFIAVVSMSNTSATSAVEVPFVLQIPAGSISSKTGSKGPDSSKVLVLVYDTTGPIPNVTSLVGAYSNQDVFGVDVVFGERVANLTMKDVVISLAPGVEFAEPDITLVNQTLGYFRLLLFNMSGEGQVNVTVRPVVDAAGNLANTNGSVSIIRDVTPAIVTLVSDSGNYVVGDSFGVSIFSNEPVLRFDDEALLLTIAQGRGAAGHTALQSHSVNNTNFSLTVSGIAPAAESNGLFSPNLTVSIQVKEGSLTDRAGNPSPPKDSPERVLLVVVDVRGQNGTIIVPRSPNAIVLTNPEQKVGSISLGALIGIVCALLAVVVCCIILVCLKRRKEANEAPDAFNKYARQVYADYGTPPTPAGVTLEQIVQRGVDGGYDEQRSRVAAERLLKAADKNGDGLLSCDEFIAWLAKVIHKANEAKYKIPPGQERKITRRDVLTLRKDFPLKGHERKKAQKTRVGVDPAFPGAAAAASSSEEDPMLRKQPVSVHI